MLYNDVKLWSEGDDSWTASLGASVRGEGDTRAEALRALADEIEAGEDEPNGGDDG